MRKIYSLVLMATALLIGTNAWADVHPTLVAGVDEAKVSKDGGNTWMYATYLKDAFDYVTMDEDETAKIVMLRDATVDVPITMPKAEDISPVNMVGANAKAGQKIELNLNGKTVTSSSVTPIRILKGKLDITGTGTVQNISSADASSKAMLVDAVIALSGAQDATAIDWSVLTVGKNVTLYSTRKYVISVTNWGSTDINDPVFKPSKDNNNQAITGGYDIASASSQISKFGYATRAHVNNLWNDGKDVTDIEADMSNYVNGVDPRLPMACAAAATAHKDSNKQPDGKYCGLLQGCAFGVKVTIEGTITNGRTTDDKKGAYGIEVNGNINQVPACAGADATFPKIIIEKGAIISAPNVGSAIGVYSAGYSEMVIKGEVYGATGIYMKSGKVVLNDATVWSNYPGSDVNWGTNGDGGVHGAGGSAIVTESTGNYAGGMSVTVQGDTKISGGGGYAIFDQTTVTTDDEDRKTTTSNIKIEGGTIESGGQGAIAITLGAVDVTTIAGGNLEGTNSVNVNVVENPGTDQETITPVVISNFITEGTHTTTVTDGTKVIVVVSQGAALTDYAHVQGNPKDSVKWIGTGADATEELSDNLTLKELEINQDWVQTLIIPNGITLSVGRVVLGVNARIIVNAGGKFIVTGDQGIVAPKVENILIKTSETAQGIFLFHPEVSSNRHPNATVEFISNSYVDAPNYAAQRFGIPTHGKLTGISAKRNNTDVETAFAYLNYAADEWTIFGYINSDKGTLDLENMKSAFGFYQMVNNTPDKGTVVTMTGELYGNLDPTLPIIANKWNGYANSYMAPIDAKKLMSMIPSSVDKAFHVYEVDAEGDGEWVAVSNLELHDVRPLQAFLLRNMHDEANVTINYAQAVYAPMVPSYTPGAPARHIENNMTMATLIVKGEMSKDRVVIAEDAQFSAEFDNGYDAAKYMNDGINLYVSADEKMAHFATDDLENTYLGFQAVNGGKYTLEFANVQGEELTLIDLENNASVVMVDGNKYEFTADAKSVNDYRFKIVSTFNAPTAIENTEAAKNAKGIYTITGQYVGEMNVWNSLPAGIYVVNGDKRVK